MTNAAPPSGLRVRLTQDVREYAANGMKDMSEKFKASGSELYQEEFNIIEEVAD